jgi:hypothetical protein
MKKEDKNGTSKWIFLAGLAAFGAMAAFLIFSGKQKETAAISATNTPAPAPQAAPEIPGGAAPAALVETNPVLPYANYAGRAARTYKIAAEIPGAIDGLYCYCKCKENPMFRHKTLLTCFTNDHAAQCDICMHEAEMADELTKQGKTPKEIRVAVDDWYEKHPNL